MTNTNKMVVNLSSNAKDDKSTVALTVANAALASNMEVAIFLSSDAVELSRSGACEYTHVQPFKKLSELIESFVANGGTLWACTPCFNHRGLKADETVEGTIVTGAGPMLQWIGSGANVISY